ncbi:glycoside hydrolase family 18 [Pedobacter sp. MC2016-14]|uniref:glycoside hydrolase family 18 n=1 Tax=Pedobacter sp. MC2016-14 TaxID=2897327 RepID=UPI001E4482B3|nr:glycoside hydrolase family 18 [Pedobacter sp. MC2016-14]MCD0488699.1 glycoside hydrolase family 18 [Pedobacter sp. MC2016-14]
MKTKLFKLLLICCAAFLMSCEKQNTPKALNLLKPYTYSEQYYTNLRAYKKSKHQVFYGWFAAYANKEGVTAEYKKSASWGEHFAGLPDSLDFCSLWMGIPSLRENDKLSTYNPIAYNEMREVMVKKGTKMLIPEITRIAKYPQFEKNDAGIQMYADYLVNMVFEYDLDGLDLDYEPEGDWIQGANFLKMVEIIGKSIGPKSSRPDKYLIIDYYTQLPVAGVEPYINYLVNQSYTQGTTSSSATFLQGRYNSVASWCPTSKFIVTENFGDWYANGGSPFTEADGNTLTTGGRRMYSLEGMARWNPTQGKKAGFGAFYFDRDYNSGDPYSTVRRSIQIANPAVR